MPGSLLPQQGIDPAAVPQYYAAHPALAPGPGPAGAVQRVRRALVRGDLPAAVRSPWPAACCRGRSGWPARPGQQPPPRPAQPGPAAAVRPVTMTALAPDDALASAAALLRGPAVPAAHRRRLGVGGKGLPARGRQPAVPPGPARPAGRGRPGRACSATRRTGCWSRADSFANTVTAWTQFRPGRLVSAARPAAVHDHADQLPGLLRHLRARSAASRRRSTPRSGYSAQPGAAARHVQPAGQPPAERGRRAGVPDRPRVRAGVQGHRRHRAGGLRPAGAVHPGGAGRASPPKAWSRSRTPQPRPAGVRRGVPAHRGRRRRPAGLRLPRAPAQPAGQPGLATRATWA